MARNSPDRELQSYTDLLGLTETLQMAYKHTDKNYRLKEKFSEGIDSVRRAFEEFLTFPSLIIAGFILLSVASYVLDYERFSTLEPIRFFLKSHVFANPEATNNLLSAVAAGIIAVTSIMITLLLVVAQQSAASMTSQVFDQFLRRPANQFYFGFFVGLALYALMTLATVNEPFNPVFGGTLVFVLTVVALYLLIILLYTTINQMRPIEIIEAIHTHILSSREKQIRIIRCTQPAPGFDGPVTKQIKSLQHGYIARINFQEIGAAIKNTSARTEVVIRLPIGSFVAFQDLLAEVKTHDKKTAENMGKVVMDAIHIDRQRDIATDPGFGIEQLEMIAWTSISTAKSNPMPGLLTIRSLRDVLARWSFEQQENDRNGREVFPVVYQDNIPEKLLDAFETFAVVSSESMQHQTYAEVILAFTSLFDRLPLEWRSQCENSILRILSVLGDHAPTGELNEALSSLVEKLICSDRSETAAAVESAREKLQSTTGKLNSRSTRANGRPPSSIGLF